MQFRCSNGDLRQALCRHFHVGAPTASAVFYQAHFPGFELLWERHREFVAYTFIRQGSFDYNRPFADSVSDVLPPHWLEEMVTPDHPSKYVGTLSGLIGFLCISVLSQNGDSPAQAYRGLEHGLGAVPGGHNSNYRHRGGLV